MDSIKSDNTSDKERNIMKSLFNMRIPDSTIEKLKKKNQHMMENLSPTYRNAADE
jgi:hypothetical protein